MTDKIPRKTDAILQLLYFGLDKSGNLFYEKWTAPPKEFRKAMDKWNENYVDTIRYEHLIKYIDNLWEQTIKDVRGYLG